VDLIFFTFAPHSPILVRADVSKVDNMYYIFTNEHVCSLSPGNELEHETNALSHKRSGFQSFCSRRTATK